MCFVSLSSIVRAHLDDLFPGREVTEFSRFRVTRHSDMALDEEDVRNLRTALRQGLQQRHYGQAVRLEVSAGCSAFCQTFARAICCHQLLCFASLGLSIWCG